MTNLELIEEQPKIKDVITKTHRRPIQKWKNQEMMYKHSIRATVNEIIQVTKSLDLVKIGVIGEPSTGKTTLALLLAHLIHKMSDIPWAIKVFGEEEFLDMKTTLKGLEPANYILYFHDLSFLQDRRKLEEVKAAITKIRHLKTDVKIILIYDYHYTLGLDKYLRQANFFYYTSVGSSEVENMIKIVGTKWTKLIEDFKQKYVEMTTKQKCTFQLSGDKYFVYNYKNPFVVALFYNNSRLRYVIFPTREWVDPICSKCSSANSKVFYNSIPIDQFKEECDQKWGSAFKSALKLQLLTNGMNVYNPKIVQAMRYLSRALEKQQISLEDLAVAYNLKITNTKLRKKLDGILATYNK